MDQRDPISPRRMKVWIGLGVLALSTLVACIAYPALRSSPAESNEADAAKEEALTVTTVKPVQKTLVRSLVQPGTIEAWAEAELYAKASGYVEAIQVDITPRHAARLVASGFAPAGQFGGIVPTKLLAPALATERAFNDASEKDIGDRVHKGELLMEIDSPEREQLVAERAVVYEQRQAELEQARSMLASYEAAIRAAEAQQLEVEADIKRCAAECDYSRKQLKRLRELVKRQAINEEIAEEKQSHLEAAQAALESAKAKRDAMKAEHARATARLATGRAELKVKEVLVKVARAEMNSARIHADYAKLYAPFDGIITWRGVDVGDFVQNSTSGQTRRLMTITALDRVKVVLQGPSREAVWIKPGATATVQIDSLPGHRVVGYVGRTSSVLDLSSRTLRVEIDLDNRAHHLLPGMYGQVTVHLQEFPGAWTVPASAVYSHDGRNYILEVTDGVVHHQPVRILFDNGRELRVVKLTAGHEERCTGREELVVSNKGEVAEGQHVTTSLLVPEVSQVVKK